MHGALQVDKEARNARGMTALHQAAWYGQAEAVRLLLLGGADPCSKTLEVLIPPADSRSTQRALRKPRKARSFGSRALDRALPVVRGAASEEQAGSREQTEHSRALECICHVRCGNRG